MQYMLHGLYQPRPNAAILRGKEKEHSFLREVILAIGPKDWPLLARKALQERFGISCVKLRNCVQTHF
ncbi:hypothetical protein GCM10027511_18590 [Hymenobacter humi]